MLQWRSHDITDTLALRRCGTGSYTPKGAGGRKRDRSTRTATRADYESRVSHRSPLSSPLSSTGFGVLSDKGRGRGEKGTEYPTANKECPITKAGIRSIHTGNRRGLREVLAKDPPLDVGFECWVLDVRISQGQGDRSTLSRYS